MSRHHSLDYVEFTSPDPSATGLFLSEAFGWRTAEYGPDYVGFEDGEEAHEAGGVARGENAAPLAIVYSADLEATEASVVAAGGVVVTPIFAFPGGRRFVFRDPAGVTMAVWSDAT
ncbi:MAG: VOC family protein [Aeromicrobium sp.]|nr:MAG: VOC family protein [Aeromicrobium sp.]